MSLEERLKAALAAEAPADLHASDLGEEATAPVREAAVLVAVTDRPEPGILFTVRHADLRTHAGQISFPGGQVDPDDRNSAHTALREACEEIGLDAAQVRVCGTADPYRTITHYRIVPVVGVIPPDLPLKPDPREVSDLFEAPMDFVLDPANHGQAHVEFQGKRRFYTEINWQGRRIWGATAAMLVNLSRRLR
jgi:8-oxo-dGTP pyrophosphatase MutT (NUDIX family)